MSALIAPRLKPSVDVRRVEGKLFVLRADIAGEDLELEGDTAWIESLLELLDGTRGIDALRSALETRGLRSDGEVIASALSELDAAGLIEDPSESDRLTQYERDRFSRQLAYFADVASTGQAAASAQQRLRDAVVCVIGVGGLGSWTLYALACTGVGTLRLVDGDCLELSNLNRQILFSESELGMPKVELAAARLAAFAPKTTIEIHAGRLESADAVASVVAGADLVVDAADWPPHQIDRWVNRACVAAGVPYLAMSQQPPMLRVGPLYAPERTGCYECLESAFRDEFPEYDQVAAATPSVSRAATFGPACAAVGALAAADAVHFLSGLFEPPTLGRALTIDLRDHSVSWRRVDRRANCSVCSGGAETVIRSTHWRDPSVPMPG